LNPVALGQALEHEFNLPYADGTTMGLAQHAKKCFGKRLGLRLK